MAFQRAVKSQAKLRMTFDGPAGSGKTFSSLVLARELGGRTALIDTEHGSASKYADLFTFDQVSPDEFSLDTYLALIREARGYDNLIIDSLSHAWMGRGGALEEVDRTGGTNKFTNGWRGVTPKHNQLIDAILSFPGHVICTMRKKMEYVLETDSKGRQVPKKVGMAPVQREGMEYEFDVVADIDTDGNVTIAKTRCPALTAKRNQLRHADVPELGQMLKAWLTDGVAPPPPPSAPKAEASADKLTPAADVKKMVDAFDGLGIDNETLQYRLGHSLDRVTHAEFADLRKFFAETKALAAETPEQLAKRLEQEKAEAGIATEKAAGEMRRPVSAYTVTVEPPKFEHFISKIRAATTVAAVVLIESEAAQVKAFTNGDRKALVRAATDRKFILEDAARRKPPPSTDLQF